jgi:hypothetical protein
VRNRDQSCTAQQHGNAPVGCLSFRRRYFSNQSFENGHALESENYELLAGFSAYVHVQALYGLPDNRFYNSLDKRPRFLD